MSFGTMILAVAHELPSDRRTVRSKIGSFGTRNEVCEKVPNTQRRAAQRLSGEWPGRADFKIRKNRGSRQVLSVVAATWRSKRSRSATRIARYRNSESAGRRWPRWSDDSRLLGSGPSARWSSAGRVGQLRQQVCPLFGQLAIERGELLVDSIVRFGQHLAAVAGGRSRERAVHRLGYGRSEIRPQPAPRRVERAAERNPRGQRADVAERFLQLGVDVEPRECVADAGRDLNLLLHQMDVAGEAVAFQRDADVQRGGGRGERQPQLVGAAQPQLGQHDPAAIDQQLVAGHRAGAVDRGLQFERQRAAGDEPQPHRLVVAGRLVGDVSERAEQFERLAADPRRCLAIAACE